MKFLIRRCTTWILLQYIIHAGKYKRTTYVWQYLHNFTLYKMSKIVPFEQRWLSLKADCNLIQISPDLSTFSLLIELIWFPHIFVRLCLYWLQSKNNKSSLDIRNMQSAYTKEFDMYGQMSLDLNRRRKFNILVFFIGSSFLSLSRKCTRIRFVYQKIIVLAIKLKFWLHWWN